MSASARLSSYSGQSPNNSEPGVDWTGIAGVPPGAERFGDVLVLPVPGEPAHYWYLPLGVGLQKNPDGSVQAQVIAAGSAGFLQLTSVWDISSEALEAIRETLSARVGDTSTSTVMMSFAPVSDVAARLMVRLGDEMRPLAERKAANSPPFTTLFNMSLDQDALAAVTAAINGQAGNLEIHYIANLSAPEVHHARLTGDLTGVSNRNSLNRALEDARVHITMPVRSAEFRNILLDRAIEILSLGTVASGSQTVIEVKHIVERDVPVHAGTDVAAWFGPGNAPRVVTPVPVVPTPPVDDSEPEETVLTLRLAEPDIMADVIAFVEVTAGSNSVQVTADDPVADIQNVRAGRTLCLATHYLRGGNPFESEVTVGEDQELELDHSALGIVIVRVDAKPLQDVGYDRVRATLRYMPKDRLFRDTATLRFRDTSFKTQIWPIVARSTPLGDSLTYQFRAESLDPGLPSLRVPETVATGPDITLAPGPANEE